MRSGRNAWMGGGLAALFPLVAPLFAAAMVPPAYGQEAQKPPVAVSSQIEAARAAMVRDPKAALGYAEAAQQRATSITNTLTRAHAEATALWMQGEALIRMGQPEAAGPRITKALRLISSDQSPSKLRGDLLIAQAGVQEGQMRFAEALASLQEGHRNFVAANEPRSQSIALQMIAALYSKAGDLPSAAKYYTQAAQAYSGDPRLQIYLLNNQGNVQLQMEEPKHAESSYRDALQIARAEREVGLLPDILLNVSWALLAQKRFAEADAAIAEAQRYLGTAPAGLVRQRLLAASAESQRRQGNLKRALTLIEQAFSGVDLNKTGFILREAHLTAFETYRDTGNAPLALRHLERLGALKDEATKMATSTSSALMAARFDYANQELRIANLEATRLRREAEVQRTLFYGVGGAGLLIVILLSIGLITIRRSRNQVRDANAVLAQTNVALEKALKAKTEFLATTSHEIRTPLNGILGMTQIMLRDPKVPAETRDRIDIVHSAGMTMRGLVDDILDMAKMETGNLTVDMTATDLHATLKDVTRIWEEQARAKDLSFTLKFDGTPRWIETDPGRLRQILFNLLSNAVKFTQRGGLAVVVTASDGELQIAVRDTGIGIPRDKFDEVFESFRQVDAGTTRQFGGTGLGLAIVKNLVEALGGQISLDSVVGRGSTFTINLPLTLAEAPQGHDDAPAAAEAIVVLDRNPIIRGMLRTLFAPHFANVAFAATTDEAIKLAEAAVPALLLVDEATAASQGDPVEILKDIVARAPAGVRTAALWKPVDAATDAVVAATGIGQLVFKPVKGPDLVAALTANSCKNTMTNSATKLVSRAA